MNVLCQQEFLSSTDTRSMVKLLSAKTDLAMRQRDSDILDKKKRLEDALNEESEILGHEFESHKLRLAESRIEELKKKSISVQLELEAKRKAIADHKLELYRRENSENARTRESMEKCNEVSASNKIQIEQNQKMKAAKKELERVLDEITNEHHKKKAEIEDALAKRKMRESAYDCEILRHQIIEKTLKMKEEASILVEEYARLKQLVKHYEDEEKRELLKQIEDKHTLAQQKYDDLIQVMELKKKNKAQEKELASQYSMTLAPLMKSDCQTENRKRELKLEQQLFIEKQQQLKMQIAIAEKKENEFRAQECNRKDDETRKANLQVELMRQKRNQDLLKTQMFQVIGMISNST